MVQFIKQEANEKAREIAIATEEEFNIEKLSMVDGEKIKIAKEYERKETTVDTAKKIEASTGRNAMRLKVLSARAQAMETVVEEARAKLAETSADAGRYRTLMTALIVQGARKLGDASVRVRCRECDAAVAREAVARMAPADWYDYGGARVARLRLHAHDSATPMIIQTALQTLGAQGSQNSDFPNKGFPEDGIYESPSILKP